MREYRGLANILVRAGWLFEYLSTCITLIAENRDWDLYRSTTTSYEKVLAPRHSYVLQYIVKGITWAVSDKEFFFGRFQSE
jgi:hypothetical protein